MKRELFRLILLFSLLIPRADLLLSQTVSTFVSGSRLNGPDGFAFDRAGNLYVANWGNGNGSTVLRITPDGEVIIHLSGLSAPDGLAFDTAGNLYVSNYSSGVIHRVTPAGLSIEFSKALDTPSDLAFDSHGNLFVSNHGGGNGTTVSAISPSGGVSTYASGFEAPLGLVFDTHGALFVSNYASGSIHKVTPDGVAIVFATIPNSPPARLQYLSLDRQGNLYVPSYGHNKIYVVSAEGQVGVFAGTGVAGGTDGPAGSAQFDGPNSIAIDNSGTIYVSEYNANRIRKISQD